MNCAVRYSNLPQRHNIVYNLGLNVLGVAEWRRKSSTCFNLRWLKYLFNELLYPIFVAGDLIALNEIEITLTLQDIKFSFGFGFGLGH